MRFILKDKPKERVITRFLFLPKKIGKEVRWLEKVSYLQVRNPLEGFYTDVEFIDEGELSYDA